MKRKKVVEIQKLDILSVRKTKAMLNSLKLEDIKPELINLTGVRLLVLFSLLIESPKTAEEISDYFEKNNYPKNIFSIDTLRNDMNALRSAGCKISRADKSNNFQYKLLSHPFEMTITMDLAKSFEKLYNNIFNRLTIQQLLLIENLFETISKYALDIETAEYLNGISLLKRLNKNILNDLVKAKNCKNKISFVYDSPNSGKQDIEFYVTDFEFRSKKLYINGYCPTFKNNSFLLVSKITSPVMFHLEKGLIQDLIKIVILELKNASFLNYQKTENESVIEKKNNTLNIEYKSDNDFKLMQKILAYGPDCTVISPEDVRQSVKEKLKSMLEVYKND